MFIQKILKSRLDVIVKVLYIKGYIEGKNFNYYKKLYAKHIKLYNGCKEDDKKTIEDFFESFNKLIKKFKKNGYNINYPIPLNPNGEILNGAHRLACCLYFGVEPITINLNKNLHIERGLNWFKKNLFTNFEIIDILEEYNKYVDLDIMVIWPGYTKKKKEISKYLQEYNVSTLGHLKINLTKLQFVEIVNDIYSYDEPILTNTIYPKAVGFTYMSSKLEILIIENNTNIDKKSIKKIIRKKVVNKKDSLYNTFHRGDNQDETRYIKTILLNNSNLKYLKRRKGLVKTSFYKKLEQLDNFLNIEKINKNNYCIVGSGSLGVYDIVKVSDIDIILSKYNDTGVIKKKDIDILDYKYYHETDNREIITQKRCHFYFRSFKFIDLSILMKIKGITGYRRKDILQSQKIQKFLASKDSNFYENIIFEIFFLKNKIKIYIIYFCIKIIKRFGIYPKVSSLRRKYILNIKK